MKKLKNIWVFILSLLALSGFSYYYSNIIFTEYAKIARFLPDDTSFLKFPPPVENKNFLLTLGYSPLNYFYKSLPWIVGISLAVYIIYNVLSSYFGKGSGKDIRDSISFIKTGKRKNSPFKDKNFKALDDEISALLDKVNEAKENKKNLETHIDMFQKDLGSSIKDSTRSMAMDVELMKIRNLDPTLSKLDESIKDLENLSEDLILDYRLCNENIVPEHDNFFLREAVESALDYNHEDIANKKIAVKSDLSDEAVEGDYPWTIDALRRVFKFVISHLPWEKGLNIGANVTEDNIVLEISCSNVASRFENLDAEFKGIYRNERYKCYTMDMKVAKGIVEMIGGEIALRKDNNDIKFEITFKKSKI